MIKLKIKQEKINWPNHIPHEIEKVTKKQKYEQLISIGLIK